MFGQPQWFVKKTWGWGLTPVTWQGWVYTLIWTGVLIGPFLYFMRVGGGPPRLPEAFIWLGAATLALVADVWFIVRAIDARAAEPTQTPAAPAPPPEIQFLDEVPATRKYEMRPRG